MKYLFTAATLLLLRFTACCQETEMKTSNLNHFITENFYVLKADKKTRSGQYAALYKDVIIAKGDYSDNKRIGEWQFFSNAGKLVQSYNYDKKDFTFIDSGRRKGMKCTYLRETTPTDTLTNPVLIGVYFYTVAPMVTMRPDIDHMVLASSDGQDGTLIYLTHVLTINAQGVIVKHLAYTKVNGKTKYYEINDTQYNDGTQKFVPATINHVPVSCQITATTGLTATKRISPSGF